MKHVFRSLALLSVVALISARPLWADTETSTDSTTKEADSKSTESTPKGSGYAPMVELVDIPTAEILDPMTYSTTFRFYNDGGLTSRLVIGPMKRVNLGISFDAQNVIGSGNPHLITPAVYFKVRAFDGNDYLPALAFGYDNQGYLYQESTKQFLNREKGLYVVGSHEILIPDLELHAGMNMYDFNSNAALFGFLGLSYKITKNFALLSEYDNIRVLDKDRYNMGGRYWIAPYFNIDFAARNIGRGSAQGAERIIRLNYVGNFPI